MFSPCSQGVSSTKDPNRKKTCKITEHMSIPDQRLTVHLTWSPGAYKLPTAPGGSWRRDVPGWEKAENKFAATSGLRVCVSCVAYIHSRVCSSVSCVPLEPDKLLLY